MSASSEARSLASTEVIRIEPPTRWHVLPFRELWKYRELLYFFVWRDIKVRYKQTVLGIGWALVQPLMAMAVLALFFGKIGGATEKIPHYPLFVFAGLFTVIMIGLLVENLIFRSIEARTVRRWGMQN